MRNTGGNKYETTAREIQNYQFSTFFSRSKMTSRKVTATALKVNVKKFQPTSTSSLACVLTNLDAFCPMEVHLPGEKSILPYFSSPRGVAISVPFPEVRNRKGTETVEVGGWEEERSKKKGKTASPGNSRPPAKTAQKK